MNPVDTPGGPHDTASDNSACPPEDTLVVYAEGKLSGEQREVLLKHLNRCEECRQIVADLIKADADPAPQVSTDDSTPRFPTAGSRLGRYVILEKVGAGGMGEVYAAYDPHLDRKIALKIVHADRFDQKIEEVQGRLLREAQAMARLSHPNVLTVYDVQFAEQGAGDVVIAMEFIDGMTLGQWLRKQKRSWREVLEIFCQAGEGLAAAHGAGLVHRDFKPDNVLVRKDGRVFVADFGLVRKMADTQLPSGADVDGAAEGESQERYLDSALTRTGATLGTPAYMAPEQLLGEGVDARADQYAFCASLYEALYGERPYQAENLHELRRQMLTRTPTPPAFPGGS